MKTNEMQARPISNGWAVTKLRPLLEKPGPSVDEMVEALAAHPRFRAPFHEAIAAMADRPEGILGGDPVEDLVLGLSDAIADPDLG